MQLDVLRGFAAISVVLLHTFSRETLLNSWAVLHIWQAVPVFIFLMGVTARMSLDRRGGDARSFTRARIIRLIAPFTVVWVISLALALVQSQPLSLGWNTLLMALPGPGRGAYFVAVAIFLVLLAPLLYRFLVKSPSLTLVVALLLDLGFELLAPSVPLLADPWRYAVSPFRYLWLFALGMWVGRPSDDMRLRRTAWWAIPYGAVSVAYLVWVNLTDWSPRFLVPGWVAQNPAGFGYALLLCMAAVTLLPQSSDNIVLRILSLLGTASWHIFLVQMIVVVVAPSTSLFRAVVNVSVSCTLGVLWSLAEAEFASSWRKRDRRRNPLKAA